MTPRGRDGLLADSASRLRGDGQGAEGERTTAAVCRAGGSHGAGVGAGAGWVHDWFAGASDGFDGFDDQPRRPGELSGRTSRPADNPAGDGPRMPGNLPTRRASRRWPVESAAKPSDSPSKPTPQGTARRETFRLAVKPAGDGPRMPGNLPTRRVCRGWAGRIRRETFRPAVYSAVGGSNPPGNLPTRRQNRPLRSRHAGKPSDPPCLQGVGGSNPPGNLRTRRV